VRDFVGIVSERGGASVFIVHARNAWLRGVSPKENRELPPLRHDVVRALKRDFPELVFVGNGGIADGGAIEAQLTSLDGVMVGRAAYHHPWDLADWDRRFFADAPQALERDAVEDAMVDYMERLGPRTGEPWSHVSRHILGLRNGQAGARRWRQVWSDHRLKSEPPRVVSRLAREALAGRVSAAIETATSPAPRLPAPARTQPLATS
jgi:tRNA-dihydrouridine synthase A